MADFNKKSVKLNLSPEQQAFYNLLGGQATDWMTGGGYGAGTAAALEGVGGMLPGLFGGALDASAVDPVSLAAYNQRMGMLGDASGSIFGGLANQGMNVLGGNAPGMGQALSMFGLGQQLAGQTYDDVYAQRLGLLREQAAPFEERALNSFQQRQYNMGRMGSTGGGRDVEAFARGLGQADTTRQLDAMNLAESLYGRNLAAGQGFMGTGLQGIFSGYGAGTNMLGAAGQFGCLCGNTTHSMFGANQGFNALVNARAQQRMANASQLFGFGQNLNQNIMETGLGLNAAQRNIVNSLIQQGQLGVAAAGGGQATTPGNAGQSALGGLLQGFGTAAIQNPGIFSGMFGGWQTGQQRTGYDQGFLDSIGGLGGGW
jgi:hypothetical protein